MAALPLAVGAAAGWSARPAQPADLGLQVATPPVSEQGGSGELELEARRLRGAQLAIVQLPDGIGV